MKTAPSIATEGARRGRPRTITRERIADAGIEIGLPNITIVGVAARLGVSHMALYKHVRGLEALKRLVAEEIFDRWRLPQPQDSGCGDLERYLVRFSSSMWQLIDQHPGLAPYLLRRDTITPSMMAKIAAHQERIAEGYGVSITRSRWILFTISYHCVALADTVHADGANDDVPPLEQPGKVPAAFAGIDPEHALGVRALIVGALAVIGAAGGDDPGYPGSDHRP